MNKTTTLKQGILINVVSKYSNIILQLLINSILARLLAPSEFGLVAIVMVFISFFTVLGDMGIGPAIIQDKTLSKKEISDIFIFSVFAAVIIAIGFYFFSYFISYFYENKIYITLGAMLSISIFFSIINVVPNALIYKDKNFKLVGIINVGTNVIVGCITIGLAIKGWSYYALILDSILKSLSMFCMCFINSKIRLYKSFNLNSVKKIRGYSSYQFLFNFINYFTRNLDNILVGKFLGVNSLAYYDKAYKLMLYPVQNLTYVITPVLHPVLSDYQNDKEVIYATYLKIVKFLAVAGVFVSVFCLFSAKEIIYIMYGPQWGDSIVIFKILSISIVVQMILSSIGSIFQATGYVNKLFSTGIISSIFTVTAILIGVLKGSIVYLSIGIVISFIFNFIQCFYVLIKNVFNRDFIKFLLQLKSIIVITICMVIGYVIISPLNISNLYLSIVIKLIVGILTYSIGLFITKEYKLFISVLLKR
ncbi:lipopolysaccharide biosynthesis protein [Clostridium polyendosporum]|uniref:Lipopolysaccharide biosynthesis protein n=1 Tax=Clostridium polyendosporum TaxID=69208 RepID=A0A919VHC6_9CLOT|nr:lipopolysaccharide biosynthesis protein [Clostridium polyendosporum]GIM30255.1 lipopolysaccharide biosynthesis protein [Clostridium polyendosporum]